MDKAGNSRKPPIEMILSPHVADSDLESEYILGRRVVGWIQENEQEIRESEKTQVFVVIESFETSEEFVRRLDQLIVSGVKPSLALLYATFENTFVQKYGRKPNDDSEIIAYAKERKQSKKEEEDTTYVNRQIESLDEAFELLTKMGKKLRVIFEPRAQESTQSFITLRYNSFVQNIRNLMVLFKKGDFQDSVQEFGDAIRDFAVVNIARERIVSDLVQTISKDVPNALAIFLQYGSAHSGIVWRLRQVGLKAKYDYIGRDEEGIVRFEPLTSIIKKYIAFNERYCREHGEEIISLKPQRSPDGLGWSFLVEEPEISKVDWYLGCIAAVIMKAMEDSRNYRYLIRSPNEYTRVILDAVKKVQDRITVDKSQEEEYCAQIVAVLKQALGERVYENDDDLLDALKQASIFNPAT